MHIQWNLDKWKSKGNKIFIDFFKIYLFIIRLVNYRITSILHLFLGFTSFFSKCCFEFLFYLHGRPTTDNSENKQNDTKNMITNDKQLLIKLLDTQEML